MSSLDPEQVGVLSNAGGFLLQADEAGQAAVTVVLRSLQDLERLVKEASAKDVRDGYDPLCLHSAGRDAVYSSWTRGPSCAVIILQCVVGGRTVLCSCFVCLAPRFLYH